VSPVSTGVALLRRACCRQGQHGSRRFTTDLVPRDFRLTPDGTPRSSLVTVWSSCGYAVENALDLFNQSVAIVGASGRERRKITPPTSATVPAVSFRIWRCSNRHHERWQPDRHLRLRSLPARMGRRRQTADRHDDVKAVCSGGSIVLHVFGMNCCIVCRPSGSTRGKVRWQRSSHGTDSGSRRSAVVQGSVG